jgi:hypothetical protein
MLKDPSLKCIRSPPSESTSLVTGGVVLPGNTCREETFGGKS